MSFVTVKLLLEGTSAPLAARRDLLEGSYRGTGTDEEE